MTTRRTATIVGEPTPNTCPSCGVGRLLKMTGSYETTFAYCDEKRALTVPQLTWLQCDSCHEAIFDDAAANLIDDAKYSLLQLLSPKRILALRQRYGKTQEDMADLLGIGRKTYCRWENGTFIQTRANDNYLRLVSWLLDNITDPIPVLEGLRKDASSHCTHSHSPKREQPPGHTFEPNLRQHLSKSCCSAMGH